MNKSAINNVINLAISSLRHGNEIVLYGSDHGEKATRAMIYAPLQNIDSDMLHNYAMKSGYIILTKEKINSLYANSIDHNLHLNINIENCENIYKIIKDSLYSYPTDMGAIPVNFSSATTASDIAILLTKEAEEIPILLARDLCVDTIEEAKSFANKNNILSVSYNDYLAQNKRAKCSLWITSELKLQNVGKVLLSLYKDSTKYHSVILKNNSGKDWVNPLVRIHSSCCTGDILGSSLCDCREQLQKSLQKISNDKEGGILIYLNQEGRNIGLHNKLMAYNLQRKCGVDTIEANHILGFASDERSFDAAIQILQDIKVNKIRLLTNNPMKNQCLRNSDITVENIALITAINPHNKIYLETKAKKMGHNILGCV